VVVGQLGQHGSDVAVDAELLPPVARVAERDLLEAHAVDPVGAAGVQVAGDDDAGAVTRCQSWVARVPHHGV
jgi:hypothetical protein